MILSRLIRSGGQVQRPGIGDDAGYPGGQRRASRTGALLEALGQGLQANPLGGPVRPAQQVGATFLQVLRGRVVTQISREKHVGTGLPSPLQE